MSDTGDNVVTEEPVAAEPAAEEPAVVEPVVEPVAEEPAVAEPVVEEHVAEPATEDHAEESIPEIDIDESIRELYQIVSKKIHLSIANGKLSPDNFQIMLMKIVETIEDLRDSRLENLTGIEKRSIATNVTRLVIDDLHAHGHIDDEVYGWLSIGITFLAPALFTGMKAIYNKAHEVVSDIGDNGVSGCCRRNFRRA